ncbi:MAG: DUF6265 family protein [Chitinophagaceae bacterium]|nr:DUF6265 family protein [Chitinophagaceae bacterium]
MKYIPMFLFTALVSATGLAQTAQDNFKKLNSLQGLWQMTTSRGVLHEEWKTSGNDIMKSQSYRVNNNDTVMMETAELLKKGKDIFYIPTVPNQNQGKPVEFKLTSAQNNEYIFENPEHDFPQRIIYNLKSATETEATIDGSINGQYRKMVYRFSKKQVP